MGWLASISSALGGAVDSIGSAIGISIPGQITGVKVWKHKSFDRTETDGEPLSLPFTSQANLYVNEIQTRIRFTGQNTTSATLVAWFEDAQGSPIGKPIQGTYNSTSNSAFSPFTISGFGATLERGIDYVLKFDLKNPDKNIYETTKSKGSTTTYRQQIDLIPLDKGNMPAHWEIPFGKGCVMMAGSEGYQASGTAWRTLDMMDVPLGNGILTYSDFAPLGTSLKVTGYYTNDPALAATSGVTGWTDHNAALAANAIDGIVDTLPSGLTLPPARFWRFKIDLTANAVHDETPKLGSIGISYAGDPVVFATHSQSVPVTNANRNAVQGVKCLSKITATQSELDQQLKNNMTGKMTLELAPEPEVDVLYQYAIKGVRCHVRVGYNGITETLPFYDGVVDDLAFSGNMHSLYINDALDIGKAKVPNEQHPKWLSGTLYQSSDIVQFGNKSYTSTINNNTNQPDTLNGWTLSGNVWIAVNYPANTHLADMAWDIIANRLNIDGRNINKASIMQFKTLRSNMIGSRTIDKPIDAKKMLSDIAFLLEAQWVTKDQQISLIPDGTASDIVDTLDGNSIMEGLRYRRGLKDLKNMIMIETGYTGSTDGSNQDQYSDGVISYDAASALQLRKLYSQDFKDKFNVPKSEIERVCGDFITQWKDGRRLVTCNVTMDKMGLENGDVVRVKSKQLPKADKSEFTGMIKRVNLNWQKQTIALTILEVK